MRLLLGAFLTSAGYLSYRIYDKVKPVDPESDENYLILKRMEERFKSGHLKETPFPIYLELVGNLNNSNVNADLLSRPSLCQSIQFQLERDWNYFLYKMSKILLQ
jgi:hypothetical protein